MAKAKIKSIFKNKLILVLVVLGIAGGGAYAIINSSANPTGTGYIDVYTNVADAKVTAIQTGSTDASYTCSTVQTNVNGFARLTCWTFAGDTGKAYNVWVEKSGYYGQGPFQVNVRDGGRITRLPASGSINLAAIPPPPPAPTPPPPAPTPPPPAPLPALSAPTTSAMSCNTSTGTLTGGSASWTSPSRAAGAGYYFDVAPYGRDWNTGGWNRGPTTSLSISTLTGAFNPWTAPGGGPSGTLTLAPNTKYQTRVYYSSTGEHSPNGSFTTPPCSKVSVVVPPGTPPASPPPAKKAVGSTSKVVARAPTTAPTNPADTTKPTAPVNLTAEQIGNGEVELTWDESTDASGIDSYTVERSTDGTDWTILDDAVLINSYGDTTADFGVKYSYRVSAKDKSGNYSDYAVVEIETNSFSANIYNDEDSTVSSEDNIVTVKFPAGSLGEDAYCEITKDTIKTNPKGYKLAAGGYIIECKNSEGDSITELEKSAQVSMNLKSFKYKSYVAYSIDSDGKLTQIKSTFNSKNGELSFETNDLSNAFAAYGKSGGAAWWIWLLILLILVLLIIAFIRWRRSRAESAEDAYYDSAGYVTMPPSAPVGPTDSFGGGGYEQHTSLPDLVAQGQQQQQPPQQPFQEFPPAPPVQGQVGEFPEQDPNQFPNNQPGPGGSA